MHDQVLAAAGHRADHDADDTADRAAEARAESGRARPTGGVPGELRVALPSAGDITTLGEARAAIDELDAALATLLEHRAAVAAVVQRLKPVGGFAGRDPDRERRIVEAMAVRAPSLGPDRLARVMNAVIEAGLDAAEER